MLTTPPVKKIDLHFTTGMDLTARNLKGVTIKDALDTIFKANKKRVSVPAGSRTCFWMTFGGTLTHLLQPGR